MFGQAKLSAAAEHEAPNSGKSRCLVWRDYPAFPVSEVVTRYLGVPNCRDSPKRKPWCNAHTPFCPGEAVGSLAEKILLLLPVCKSCASESSCSKSCCLTISHASEGTTDTNSLSCVCSSCSASLLLLVLLRIGIRRLSEFSDAGGVLFCGNNDVPERQNKFFSLLLGPDDKWPWCSKATEKKAAVKSVNSKRADPWAHAETGEREITLASQKDDYLALMRIGYKLLPGPRDSPVQPAEPQQCPGSSLLPPLLRFISELPEALERRPELLLFLQPSRWLVPPGPPCSTAYSGVATLQQFTNRSCYGLFIALLQRAATGGGPGPFSRMGGSQSSFPGFTQSSEACSRGPPEVSEPGYALVAECFVSCPGCCWRCGGQQRISASGCVSFCCVEHWEWLCILRSRFSRVLLLFSGFAETPTTKQSGTPECTIGKGGSTGLFAADLTDLACWVNGSG